VVEENPSVVGSHLPPKGVTRALISSLREYLEVAACK
jgi:hypothetical protein